MTNLLHCELLDVDGRVYRVHSTRRPQQSRRQVQGTATAAESHPRAPKIAEGEQQWASVAAAPVSGGGAAEGDSEAEAEASVPIRQEGEAYVARVHLDAELFPFLIGRGGATWRKVEEESGASLTFPARSAPQGSPIVIQAPRRAAAACACSQIALLVSQALAGRGPRSLDYNYFLCLPLASPDTCARFERWRGTVLADPGAAAAGLEPSAFMHPQHLHLTICMLKLCSEERRALARQVLHALAPRLGELLGSQRPLAVHIKGLQYMNEDTSQVHLAYLGVQDALGSPGSLQRLQQLCAAVVAAFGQAGLLLPQDDRETRLHATVINTRYRRRASGNGDGGGQQQGGEQQQQQQAQQRRERGEPRQAFDGRWLLERHGGLDLGSVALAAVHLSQRGVYDAVSGFYRCADSLPLS